MAKLRSRSALRRALAIACLAASPTRAQAQPPTLQAVIGNPDDFRLSGSVRLRFESLDGEPRAGLADHDEQLALRTIISAEYHHQALRVGVELYDSRAWLAPPVSSISANDVNTFEPVQAYFGIDLGAALGKGSDTRLTAGRMTLNLGSTRLVSSDEYRNDTNGYTGLRADLKTRDGTTATLIYVLPQIRLPNDQPSVRRGAVQLDRETTDLQLWGGIVDRPRTLGAASAELTYVHLQETSTPQLPSRARHLDTFGARIYRAPAQGKWDFEIEAYHQAGSIAATVTPGAARQAVAANFARAFVGYSVPGPLNLHLSANYDYASGDRPGGRYNRFDTLFGSRRGDLSPAGIYAVVGRANISSPGARAEIAPGKRFDAFLCYRALYLDAAEDAFSTSGVRDATGRSGRFAGHQIDSRVRYWLVPGVLRAEADATVLIKGRFLQTAPNAPRTGNTRYLSTAISAFF